MSEEHYLKQELFELIGRDRRAFEFLHSGALDGMWYWDLEAPENEWLSPRFWEVLGFGVEERMRAPSEWQKLIFPEDLETAKVNLAKHIADASHPFDQTVRYRHKNGSTIWMRCRGIAIRDREGKAIRLLGTQTNLTQLMQTKEEFYEKTIELQQVNRELEKREAKFRSLVESAPDAVVITDSKGLIILVNAQTEKLFGYHRDELSGQPVEKLIPQRYRGQHPGYRKKYHDSPHARPMGSGMELFGLKKNGEEFPVEISLNVMEAEDGRMVSAAIRDVTAQKHAAEQIKSANATLKHQAEELEKSNLELQHFAYVVSHDLQTPLRSISGFVQLLQQEYGDKLDDQASEWIRRTVTGTQRMQTLIHDILAYSRVDARVHSFTKLSLSAVFDEVVEVLTDSIRESGAVVSSENLPEIMGDRPQMVQLLQNLIGNAIKYRSEDAPQICVTGVDSGNEWTVTVSDNGIGIAPSQFQRIFDVFQRLHTQKAMPGTGIGLSICRRVVIRHGGKIWVESVPGKGSQFCFTIPKSEKEPHE